MELKDVKLASRIAKILKEAPAESSTRQLLEWYEKEKINGLISINVTCAESVSGHEDLSDADLASVIEAHANEFMRMVNAPDIPDRELL